MFPPTAILIATDFSPGSRSAIALAVWLARRCNAELHVLHVLDPHLTAAATQAGVDLVADARRELSTFVEAISPHTSESLTLHVVVGDTTRGILEVAHRERADLIVIGASGMSGSRPLGTMTAQLLRECERPVLVVPTTWTVPDDRTEVSAKPLMVAVDATEPSLLAVRAANALAKRLGTTVEIVHVVPVLRALDRWKPYADTAVGTRLRGARGEISRLLTTAGPVARTHISSGDVAASLASSCTESGSQLLLMLGRRGRSTPDGAPGATAERVASLATVPVLMYRDVDSDTWAFSR